MKAVILAGGLGTRLSEETVMRPKPMVEIGGRPILWHVMKIYAAHGITDFIICLGYKGVQIKEYFANYRLHQSDITVDLARGMMVTCGKFALGTAAFAEQQSEVLSDIMMAQDFQDLSGQVIQKVIDIITRTELQLVQLLVDSSPETVAQEKEQAPVALSVDTHVLTGPQTADKALQQSDVDDLLASLGF